MIVTDDGPGIRPAIRNASSIGYTARPGPVPMVRSAAASACHRSRAGGAARRPLVGRGIRATVAPHGNAPADEPGRQRCASGPAHRSGQRVFCTARSPRARAVSAWSIERRSSRPSRSSICTPTGRRHMSTRHGRHLRHRACSWEQRAPGRQRRAGGLRPVFLSTFQNCSRVGACPRRRADPRLATRGPRLLLVGPRSMPPWRRRLGRVVIAQVNPRMPRTLGNSFVRFDQIDLAVEGGRADADPATEPAT